MIAAVVLLFGCGSEIPKPDQTATISGIAGVVAHTESADAAVAGAEPFVSSDGKPFLTMAHSEHAATLREADNARKGIESTQRAIASLDATVAQQQAEYATLEGRWYVRVGRWIQWAFWACVVGYGLSALASILLPVLLPGSGIAGSLSLNLVRLLPAMNWAAWIRDGVLRAKGLPTLAKAAEVAKGRKR